MRAIKFRGKRVDNGQWLHGSLMNNIFINLDDEPIPYIIQDRDDYDWDDIAHCIDDYEVIPKTVGQYTGKKDKKDVEIYDGDILAMKWLGGETTYGTVIWNGNGFDLATDCEPMRERFLYKDAKWLEVIGNIHDKEE